MLLKHAYLAWIGAVLALSSAGGCTDLGTPDYSSHDGLRPPPFNPPPVPPDPFQPGDERLSVGYFYEGGWSVEIPINQVTTNYFIFGLPDDVTNFTYSQVDSDDRMEGLISVEITLTRPCAPSADCFWGGGIFWDIVPIDISEWTTMFVSFKSSDPSFEDFKIKVLSGAGEDASEFSVDASMYGYTNDGQWYFLEIPLEDFGARFNPRLTRSPFIISSVPPDDPNYPEGIVVNKGDVMLIDNLYFTKDVRDDTGGAGGTSGSGACDSTALAYIQTLDPNAGFSRTNFVELDTTNLPDTWGRYMLSLDLTDPLLEGQLIQFGFRATASNFEPSGVFYDNIEVATAGIGGSGGDGGTPLDAEYEQDFESLDPQDPDALANDEWLVFGQAFEEDGETLAYPYGPDPAPNGGAGFCAIDTGQGGNEQGANQLSIYSDYNNQDHATGRRIEASTFRERDIDATDRRKIVTFSFDAKRGNINDGCPSP